jgi:hypothetical protein
MNYLEEEIFLKRKLLISLVAGTLIVTSASVGAFAASNLQAIKANLNLGLKFKVDGKEWVPTDQNGKTVYAITYNGTTYLPIRSAGNALGVEVGWDGKNNTVWLGEGALEAEQGKGSDETQKQYDFDILRDYTQVVAIGEKTYLGAGNYAIDSDYNLFSPLHFLSDALNLIAIAEGEYAILETNNPFVDGVIEMNRDKMSEYYKSETKFISINQTSTYITITSPSNGKEYVISSDPNNRKGLVDTGVYNWLYVPINEMLNELGYNINLKINDSDKTIILEVSKK